MKEKGTISKKALDIATKPLKIKIMIILGTAVGIFLLLLFFITAVMALLKPIIDVFEDDPSSKENHMQENLTKEEEKFKERVNEVYEEIKKKKNISIDRAVLTATVMYTGDYEGAYDNYTEEDMLGGALESEEVMEKGVGEIKQWFDEKLFHNTPEYEKLRRYRTSKTYLRALGYAQIEKGKVDLEAYEKYLADTVVNHLYPELVRGKNAMTPTQIAREIMELADMYYLYFGERPKEENCGTGTSCKYDVFGKEVSNLKVRLLGCKDTKRGEPIAGEELVDFEKYVLGVVYGEIDTGFSSEVNKVQAIAARTFALTREKGMNGNYNIGFREEDGQWILQLRNCTEDQVYCDPDKGCAKHGDANSTVFSGTEKGNFYKGPLSEDAQLRKDVESTNGKVLLGSDGNIVLSGSYVGSVQRGWQAQALAGKDHTEILLSHYKEAVAISNSNCTSNHGDSTCTQNITGPFMNWKQCDPAWGLISMGGSNICKIGCAATSMAIQAAASGAASTIPNFNPGYLVEEGKKVGLFDGGGNAYWGNISKVVPEFYNDTQAYICGKSQSEKATIIQGLLDSGAYLILEVKGANCGGSGMHWVAVSGTTDNEILMVDPASGDQTEVFAKYGNMASRYVSFRKN